MNEKQNTFAGKRLLGIKDFCEYCGIGTSTAREWGKEIGAERRIGRRVLYDKTAIDAEIDRLGSGEDAALHLWEESVQGEESRGEEE